MPTLNSVLRTPAIRASMVTIFFFGFSGAATAPYQSVVGITELGLSDSLYAALILLAALVNVAVSVTAGVVADRIGSYRGLIMGSCLFGIAGFGLIWAIPSVLTFCIGMLLLLPVFGALNSLLFANVRAATNRMGSGDAGAVNSAVRATLSLSWVLVPGIVGLVLTGAASLLPAYLIASLACVACLAVTVLLLPRQAADPDTAIPQVGFRASYAQILTPGILLRLIAMALIGATLHINGAVLPLILTGTAGGRVADIGIIVGIVALLEVVFILLWGRILRTVPLVTVMALGTGVYVAYLYLLGFAHAPWHVYALTPVSGFGAAAIISMPITYLQDLIRDRPGLGSSLISVNLFMSAGVSAALFALGTAVSDYSGTAQLGALAGGLGLGLLLWLDGRAARLPE